MPNKSIFGSWRGRHTPAADAVNEAGGWAYKFSPEHSLAQLACTGCFNGTYYASGEQQLETILKAAQAVDSRFLAQTAIYSRQKGYMKDMPAFLLAVLSTRDPALLRSGFWRVIDNGKMLRNFVQIMRSGVVGRKSLGTSPKELVRAWIQARPPVKLFRDSVGNDPSIADILKMVHPRPATPERDALYGYLLYKDHNPEKLPDLVRQYERWKAAPNTEPVPDVPFQMLTSLPLEPAAWKEVARRGAWHQTRMNLAAYARHGVFDDKELVDALAKRLADPETVRSARAFPYQLLMAYAMLAGNTAVPASLTVALQDAMEVATENVPQIDGAVVVCPDVSGSMSSAVTGLRKGATTAVRCIDVAALVAATVLRTNPLARIMPFESGVCRMELNPRDSVMTNARQLASIGGGGTNLSAPLQLLNREKADVDFVVFISDNESWVDSYSRWAGHGTSAMQEWNQLKVRCPHAKMVCIDIQAYDTTQAQERDDILNVGGFSDQVFTVMADFAAGRLGAEHWVERIKDVQI